MSFAHFFFGGNGIWTWGLALARYGLIHSTPFSFFCLDYFSNSLVIFAQGRLWTMIFLSMLPHSRDHKDHSREHYYVWLVCWYGISLTFCLGWPWTMILLFSTSSVAGITGMNYYIWLTLNILKLIYFSCNWVVWILMHFRYW
jgi:hypothetical protein